MHHGMCDVYWWCIWTCAHWRAWLLMDGVWLVFDLALLHWWVEAIVLILCASTKFRWWVGAAFLTISQSYNPACVSCTTETLNTLPLSEQGQEKLPTHLLGKGRKAEHQWSDVLLFREQEEAYDVWHDSLWQPLVPRCIYKTPAWSKCTTF